MTLTLSTVLEPRGPAGAVVLTDEQVRSVLDAKVGGVHGTVNGRPFQGRIARMGGENLIGFRKALRAELGIEIGETIDIVIEANAGPREVEVPPALAEALAADPRAAKGFDALSPSHRKEYATWIAEAKKPETVSRRVAQAVVMLAEGKPRR